MRSVEIPYAANTADRLTRLVSLPGFVFLDSCHPYARDGRFDIVSAEPVVTLSTIGENTIVCSDGGRVETDLDPFEVLKNQFNEFPRTNPGGHFCGGAIGYFSYDLARRIECLPSLAGQDLDLPEMQLGIYTWAGVIDHQQSRAWVVCPDWSNEDLERRAALLSPHESVTPAAFATSFVVLEHVKPDIEFEDYSRQFDKIKNYIRDGDCYQVNYAQRFSAPVSGNPWDAYQRLRNLNPAPFSAYIASDDAAILSSSPERFLLLNEHQVETKPIKGTSPRYDDPLKDRKSAEQLKASSKDRAENVMIVDLMRNDIGKTCEVGSVTVPKLFDIESFAKVHHLVSTVTGTLRSDLTAVDLLKGCFPGGSITGAPKLRAMEIIEELEPTRRAIYCGSIGYLGFDGEMDTNITIRTLVHHKDRMYCWAGGGIVADSDLAGEYQESLDKASAMLEVFDHAEAQFVDH